MGSVATERRATVWAATWVPSRSPIDGFGADGYAVAWIDLDEGERIQVLVDGPAPAPGAAGTVESRAFGDASVQVFVEDARA
jgi:hypothetical protein